MFYNVVTRIGYRDFTQTSTSKIGTFSSSCGYTQRYKCFVYNNESLIYCISNDYLSSESKFRCHLWFLVLYIFH